MQTFTFVKKLEVGLLFPTKLSVFARFSVFWGFIKKSLFFLYRAMNQVEFVRNFKATPRRGFYA